MEVGGFPVSLGMLGCLASKPLLDVLTTDLLWVSGGV